eukprot:1525239-Amphidinium_carterae.3
MAEPSVRRPGSSASPNHVSMRHQKCAPVHPVPFAFCSSSCRKCSMKVLPATITLQTTDSFNTTKNVCSTSFPGTSC